MSDTRVRPRSSRGEALNNSKNAPWDPTKHGRKGLPEACQLREALTRSRREIWLTTLDSVTVLLAETTCDDQNMVLINQAHVHMFQALKPAQARVLGIGWTSRAFRTSQILIGRATLCSRILEGPLGNLWGVPGDVDEPSNVYLAVLSSCRLKPEN